MAKLGKKLKETYASFDAQNVYTIDEAIKILKKNAKAKFDETVDIAINLNVDMRQADQMVRGAISLPHGTGKTFRVIAFAKGPKAEEARKAGAQEVGDEDLMNAVLGGKSDFDRVVATPDMMGVVGRLGKVLGPRGLMPNPKLGTVTMDIAGAVQAVKNGQVQYRADDSGVVHAGVAKISFDESKIKDNILAFVGAISKAKPSGVKGVYFKKIAISTTQGAGVKVALTSVLG